MNIWIKIYPNLLSCGLLILSHAISKCKQLTTNTDDRRYTHHYMLSKVTKDIISTTAELESLQTAPCSVLSTHTLTHFLAYAYVGSGVAACWNFCSILNEQSYN